MSALGLITIYIGMLLFDAAVLAGAAFLIAERDWSAWWMLAAFFICAGSNPKGIITAWRSQNVSDSSPVGAERKRP